jgi:hypothetical protein
MTCFRYALVVLVPMVAACGGAVNGDGSGMAGSTSAGGNGRGVCRGGTGGTVTAGGSTGVGGTAGVPGSDGGGSAGDRCYASGQDYSSAVTAAEQCDPAAKEPCVAYYGVDCLQAGVNPDSVAALSAQANDYKAAGCGLPEPHSCPSFTIVMPPPYTCQAGTDGVHRCYSVCEQVMSGGATCVSQSTDCAGGLLLKGYCSDAGACCLRFGSGGAGPGTGGTTGDSGGAT